MHYFDYETEARAAGIPADKLEELRRIVEDEFPRDEMMCELHVLRACMAIRDGVATLEEVLRDTVPASTA